MEVIKLNSYTNQEKHSIFTKHLLTKAIQNTGLKKYRDCFEIDSGVIESIINGYCREAGIRSLQKNTNKLMEKIAFKLLKKIEEGEELKTKSIIVDSSNI